MGETKIMVDFDLTRTLLFIGLFSSFLVILTGMAAESNPAIQDVTGYSPPSETAACQQLGGSIGQEGLGYDTNIVWNNGTEISHRNFPIFENTEAVNDSIRLSGSATEGYWRDLVTFNQQVTIERIKIKVDKASATENVTLRAGSTDLFPGLRNPPVIDVINSSGIYEYETFIVIEERSVLPNEDFLLKTDLKRATGSTESPEVDYLVFYSEGQGIGFVTQITSSAQCSLNTLTSYVGILFTNTGNVFVDAIFNLLGLIIVVSLLLMLKEAVSVLPFIGG